MATQSISLAGLPWLSAVLVLGSLVLMGFCRRLAGPVAVLQ
jgi:hypothetical protein